MWVLLLAPAFLFPPLGRPWLLLILLLPVPWIVALFAGDDALPVTPLNGSLGLLTLMVAVSLWATYDINFSAPKVLGVVLGMAMFFGLVTAMADRHRLALALELFVMAGTVLAFIGLLGTNWIGKVAGLRKITAGLPAVIRGVPGQSEGFQPNAIAGAVIMFVPLQIAIVLDSRRALAGRVLHLAALLVTTGTVLLTQSRNGWISLAIALCAWAVWESRWTRRMAVFAGVPAVAAMAVFWSRLYPLAMRLAGTGIHGDKESRLELWSRAVAAIQDFPITGMGMNTFRRLMPVLYPASLTPPDVDVAHAHNHLLQAALDLGLPGLVAYLAIWLGAATLLILFIHRTVERNDRRVAAGIAAGMISYFLFGTVDAIALGAKVGIFFWIALALIVAFHRHGARSWTV